MTGGALAPVLLALALVVPTAARAQELVVRGRVIGPDGAAQPEQRVLLHRVDRSGGATIADALSAADGSFTLSAPPAADTAALYFVAARYEGELYIGQMFRVTGQDTVSQVLQVGVAATSASALLAETEGTVPPRAGRPATPRSWLLLLVPLLGVAAVVLYLVLPRRRVAPDRALLIRIAEIDERIEAAPPGQREAMRAERGQLIEQLRTG